MSSRSITAIVVGIIVLGVALAAVSQTLWRPFRTTSTTSHGTVSALDVRSGVGGVTLTTGDRAEVRASVTSWRPGASGRVSVEGGTLTLDGCGRWCRVQYEVTAPSGADLTGEMGSGNLTAENLGQVAFETGSGSIDLTTVQGPISVEAGSGDIRGVAAADTVKASTGSGNLTVTDAAGTVTAEAGSGNIDLTLVEPVSATLQTGSGNITATVPAGPYRIAGTTGSGNRDVNVATDPASPYVLTLDTGSGNVTVQPR